jgi:hypothetical protein
MPYPYAHYVLLGMIPLIGLAFWPFYFSRIGEVPYAQHVHAVTAIGWFVLLILQSWAIHNRKVGLHRRLGRSSFVIFPLFLVGGLMVLQTMAQATVAGFNPFMGVYGPALGLLDILAVATFAFLYYSALKTRSTVQLHARYMLGTLLLLLSPIFARLLAQHIPALQIAGPADMPLFLYSVQLANVMALAVALALYAQAPRYGRPFLLVAAVIALQAIGFQWLGFTAWWREVYTSLAGLPVAVPVALGLIAGCGIVYLGWVGPRPKAGQRPHLEPAQ